MNSGECLHAVTSLARKGNKSERGGWVHNTLFCSRPIEWEYNGVFLFIKNGEGSR